VQALGYYFAGLATLGYCETLSQVVPMMDHMKPHEIRDDTSAERFLYLPFKRYRKVPYHILGTRTHIVSVQAFHQFRTTNRS
jgi:hypothetical protein